MRSRVGGVPFEPQLVSGLVEQLAEVHFDPAVLQLMCTEIWAQAAKRSGGDVERLELRDLVQVGSLGMIFARYLDQVTARIPPANPRFALQVRAVLAAMITPQHTKHAAPRTEFLKQYFKIDDAELESVLTLLSEQRLVRRDNRRDGAWYELIHERLIRSILNWLERDGEFFRFRDALNTVRTLSSTPGWREDPDRLLNKGQLGGVVGPYKKLLNFAKHERAFLLHSAVYSASDDIEYWIEQNDAEDLDELIRGFLRSKSAEARARGAQAVERIPALQQFTTAVRGLALEDSAADVRLAAAKAFARRVPDEALFELAKELGRSDRPAFLLDLAAEVLHKRGGHSPLAWGPYWSWRVKRRLRHQRMQARAATVTAAHERVFLPSLCASLLAGATLVPLVVYAFLCVTDPGEATKVDWLYWAGGCAVVSMLLATGSAWRMGRRAIAWAVQRNQQAQYASALRLPDLGWAFGTLGLFCLLFSLSEDRPHSSIITGLVLCLLGPTLMMWSSAIGWLARASVAAGRSVVARWMWSAIWSMGAAFAPALWVWLGLGTDAGSAYMAWLDAQEGNALLLALGAVPAFAALAAPLVAVLTFAGLAGISWTSPLPGQACDYRVAEDPVLSVRQVRLERWLGVALLAAAAGAFLITHGLDVFPWAWTVRKVELEPNGKEADQIRVERGPAREDSTFVRLQLDADRPSVVRYRLTQPERDVESFGLFPKGSTLLAPVTFGPEDRGAATVDVELLRHIERDTLHTNDWQFLVSRFQLVAGSKSAGAPEWRSSLDLAIETDATALEACFTQIAMRQGPVLELKYGEETRADRQVSVSTGSEFQHLSLIRPPGDGHDLGDIWRYTLNCDSFRAVEAGRLHQEFPPLRLAEVESTLEERGSLAVGDQDVYLLFLVRGVVLP